MFPSLPSPNAYSQYTDAAGGAANAAMGAVKAKKKKQQGQMLAQPGMSDLQRDFGAAGFGPQAQGSGGMPNYGGGLNLMQALGHVANFFGLGGGGGGGFAGFGGGGGQ